MNTTQIKENKLQMILGFSIPSIIAMMLQTVITITDGYFTGNYVGEHALAAINYIFDHIEEDITVDDVERHCAYSKYHLTRIFKEETDEALYQFMKRVRLERSA